MKLKLFLGSLLLLSALGLNAQVKNIGAGAAFMGKTKFTVNGSGENGALYINTYRPILGATAFYEVSSSGFVHMFEANYSTGALADVQESDKYYIEGWTRDIFQPAKVISGFYYIGLNNRSSQRFQLPFYFGMGISYSEANPITFLGFHFGAKLRAKFYLTDRIAVWGGGSASYGSGNIQVTNNETRSVTATMLSLEAGLTFSL